MRPTPSFHTEEEFHEWVKLQQSGVPSAQATPQECNLWVSFLNSEEQYETAKLLRRHIAVMLEQEQRATKGQLQVKHVEEMSELEEQQRKELRDCEKRWDETCQAYEQQVREMQKSLEARHADEKAAYLERLHRETEPRKPRWSVELLDLRRMQSVLGRQEEFDEAAHVRAKAEKLELKEYAAWRAKRDEKIVALKDRFVAQQQKEAQGLAKRFQLARLEQERARSKEIRRLHRRFANLRQELESKQKIAAQRLAGSGAAVRAGSQNKAAAAPLSTGVRERSSTPARNGRTSPLRGLADEPRDSARSPRRVSPSPRLKDLSPSHGAAMGA